MKFRMNRSGSSSRHILTSSSKFSVIWVATLAIITYACPMASARPLRTSDCRRIVTLEEPAITPDAKTVAFISIVSDFAHSRYRQELWTVDVASGRLHLLVAGHDVSVPRWSPNGRVLTFLIRGAGGHLQLARYAGRGRSVLLTHAVNDVIDYAWRPDDAEIAFAAYDAPSHRDYFRPGDNDYTQTALTPPVHLWRVRPDGSYIHRLTSGTWTVAPTDPGGIFTSQFAWSNDGRMLYFTRLRNTFEGDNEFSRIDALDVATGTIRNVTPHDRFELSPEPFGNILAYWYPQGGDTLAQNRVHALISGKDVVLSRALDRNVGGTIWMPSGRELLACGDDGAHGAAWRIGIDGSVRLLSLGGLTMVCDSYSSSTFDSGVAASVAANGAVAFIATDATHARELYYAASLSATPRRLTNFNGFLSHLDLGQMTQFSWTGPGGEHETGVLTKPPENRPGKRYPIVLLIHGGPGLASIDSFTWEDWPLAQLIAAHGYLVFQPNYRGSDDHGNAFMLGIEKDTVRGPSADILSGLAAVKALPSADGTRVAVSGWSYGGLLTSWLITQEHDFRAAISGAAVNDEVEEYDLSVSNVQDRYYLGTSPYAPGGAAIYAQQSPITYAHAVTTPTLIWSTTGDPVVPTTMSYSFYHVLHEDHVPARFIEFVAPTHGPDTPVMTEELTNMWIAWLDRYLR